MAFLFLDDDAFPLATDDGPHSSAAMLQLLRNVEAVHQERFAKCGVAYQLNLAANDSTCRLCSAWPVAWGPKWMYFHPSEAIATATVRLRIMRVGLSVGAGLGSGNMMRVSVTTGDARGRITVPPPLSGDAAWNTAASGGQLLTATASETTLSLTARVDGRNQGDPADPLSGWVAFYLWTWSVVDTGSPEDTGEIVEEDVTTGALGVDWTAAGPLSTANPNERCIAIYTRAGNQLPGSQLGEIRQVCYYRTTNLRVGTLSNAALYVEPAVPGVLPGGLLFTGGPQISIYPMGVLSLSGLSIAADRPAFPIAAAGVYTDEPIRWQTHQTLSQELQRLVAARMPVWCFEAPRDKDVTASVNRTPWRLLSQDLRQIADNGAETSDLLSTNSASPSFLAACPVANPPPSADLNGYHALVSLVALRARASGTWSFQPRIKLRLAAYDWAGALVIAGSYTDWLWPATLNAFNPVTGDWLPLAHNVWGAVGCDDWQLRGCLVGSNVGSPQLDGSDWQRVSHHVVTMPETSITYPAVIKLQGYMESTTDYVDLAVLGFGLHSRSFAD